MNLPGYEWLKRMHESEEGRERVRKAVELNKLADEMGVKMAHLALAWCLKNTNVSTVITGASRLEQVEENMKALDVVPQLTDDLMEKIEEILENKPEPLEFQL
jgi:aryl-alcohol dehydrogenase-like predicted oxidoreductase